MLIEGGVVGRGRNSFLSVAVITCASHAQGRRFEPGRKHAVLTNEYIGIQYLFY